jgi:hypothetical protein
MAGLRLARDGGYTPFAVDALAGLATIWASVPDAECALELAMLILEHPASARDAKSRADSLRADH